MEVWADWIWPQRRRRRWLVLCRWLRKLRRIRQRQMHWRRVRGDWQRLMIGRKPEESPLAPPVEPIMQPTAAGPVSETSQPLGCASGSEAEAVALSGQTRRGRPRKIATDHVCCPYEECSSYGVLGPDPAHDLVGGGTYTTHSGETRQLYQCKVCGKRFSETAGTPLFNLKTPTHTVCVALQELAEGLGIRAVARIHGVEPDTVLDWVRKAGQHSRQVSEYLMQDLELSQVQLDELWTFVHKKARRLNDWEKLHTEYGDNWIWVAFDPVHKLVVAVFIGDRSEEEAVGLLSRLRQRLATGCLPLLTSDALPHYASAILRIFGRWVQPERQGKRGRFPNPRQRASSKTSTTAIVHKHRQNGRVVQVNHQSHLWQQASH